MSDDDIIDETPEEPPEEDPQPEIIRTTLRVVRKVPTGYMPFNEAAQSLFLEGIRKGHSQKRMTELLKLNAAVVNRWISDGAKTENDWLRAGRSQEWFLKRGRRYRNFWIDLRSAQAVAQGLVHEVMVEAALGSTEVKQVKNKATGLMEEVVIRNPGDWKAADALSKRLERMDLHPGKLRLQNADVAIAEANVAYAQANARRAHALAELAERGVHEVNGILVFPSEFIEQLVPSERTVVENAMLRLGLKVASPGAVQAMAEAQSEEEITEKENFSKRWRERLGAEGDG